MLFPFIVCLILLPHFGSTGDKCLSKGISIVQITHPVEHGEGPHWDDKRKVLYFVDIQNQTIHKYNPVTKHHDYNFIEGGPVSLIIPTNEGQFVIGRGLELVHLEWNGKDIEEIKVLAEVDKTKPNNRFNDGKADSSGRLWAGTMGPENPDLVLHQGSLYSFSAKNKFEPLLHVDQISVSNGIGWTGNDSVMFYIDSPSRKVDAFDFDLTTGVISKRRTVFKLDTYGIPGVPDGLCMDALDNIWVAIYNGQRIIHINPNTGQLLGSIKLPADAVTSCTWGGKRLKTLYVTTSRRGLTKEQLQKQPLAGSTFALEGTRARGQAKEHIINML